MSENISQNPKTAGAAAPSSLDDICVAGITPFTTIDFPGRLAGVFYLQGCPWHCRYCYNTEFLPLPPSGKIIPIEKILQFLQARRNHLEAIVFSGGEPTVHESLGDWMKAVKSMGYLIGLHTNGMRPERLRAVLPLCDWVGMDLKAPFSMYERITRVPGSGEAARQSAACVIESKVRHEFRTTVHPDLLSEEDILSLAREIASLGASHYVLQNFRPEHCSDKELRESTAAATGISANLRVSLNNLFPDFQVRE